MDHKKLLLSWKNSYEFQHFIVFEEDLIWVRRHSLSGVLDISESQFHL